MLHATLHDHHDFDKIAGLLAPDFQTVAIDWPWHGESTGLRTTERLSAMSLADVLEDVVAALELPPAFFIGNSVGGFAAARFAITNPGHVRGLVLVNSGGFQKWSLTRRLFCRILGMTLVARIAFPLLVPAYMAAQTPEDTAIAIRSQEKARTMAGARVAAALWRSFPDPGHDLCTRAAQIKAPTLIVWGSKDVVFQASGAEDVRSCIPGSRIEMFDAGHVVFSSKPVEFIKVVQPFLQSV
jgi:pimeloyl-ACP methyl ester carboxylesterase